ncbi:MAG: sulfite exporter TauE/SafE family protein [Candidatus Micrarchaeaceae archaeon]
MQISIIMLLSIEALLLFATALAVGVIGNLVGIGGGVLIMVVLLFAFRISPLIASGMSLVTILVSAAVGSLLNMRQHAISRQLLYIMALTAGAGVLFGSFLAYHVSTKPFEALLGLVSLGIGVFSVLVTRTDVRRLAGLSTSFSALSKSEREHARSCISNRASISLFAAIAGIIAGLFGIGIGGIMGTYLTAIRKLNPKVVFSSVLATMIVTSLLGASLHLLSVRSGSGVVVFIVAMVLGAALGALFGAAASSMIRLGSLRFLQGYIIISLGLITLAFSLLNV